MRHHLSSVRPHHARALLAATVVLLAACGSGGTADAPAGSGRGGVAERTAAGPGGAATGPGGAATGPGGATAGHSRDPAAGPSSAPSPGTGRVGDAPTEPADEADLPGVAARLHTPNAALAVVDAGARGIPVLGMPGAPETAALTAWAGSHRIIATGRARRLDDGVWVEVRTAPQEVLGWAHSDHLVRASLMEDVTDAFTRRFGGAVPAAGDVEDLGARLAASEAAFYDGATITLARPALVEAVGDVSYDVEVPGDEVVRGIRLRVIASPAGQGPGAQGFRMLAVERSVLCRRDVMRPDGTCDLRCVAAPEQPRWRVRAEPPPDGTRA